MLVQSLNNQNSLRSTDSNKTAFKSLRIFQDINTEKLGLAIFPDGKDTVEFSDYAQNAFIDLGKSKNAWLAGRLFTDYRHKIGNPNFLKKYIKIINDAINDVSPAILKEHKLFDGRTYKISESPESIKNIVSSIAPRYTLEDSEILNSQTVLYFKAS